MIARLLLALAAAFLAGFAEAQSLPRRTSGSGAGVLGSASVRLIATTGEAGGAPLTSGTARLSPGFAAVATQPGSITSLTAVSRATGSLELAWTAPGFDGFRGSVTAGAYRIDYSSDPSHVFSPSSYQLELATSVIPGRQESVHLTGLEPNTTYYSRIYLAGPDRYFADDSRQGEASTLAEVLIAPELAGVFASSVTISWTAPAGGTSGYELRASSTDFGGLSPGGAVVSSSTSNGLVLTLTINGLRPATTYFFRVGSLNHEGFGNFITLLGTVTLPGAAPVADLAVYPDALGRSVRLAWTNPADPDHAGVIVVVSSSPTAPPLVNGAPLSLAQNLGGGAVVRSTGPADAFTDQGLQLNSDYFYHLYSQGANQSYSVSVSTSVSLDLPPLQVPNVTSVVASDRSQIVLGWSRVTSNVDGSAFSVSTAPKAAELSHYAVYRSTSVLQANWVAVTTLPVTTQIYVDALPDPNGRFLYRIDAVDSLGNSASSLAVDTERKLYAFAGDSVTRIQLPEALAADLSAATNAYGSDIVLRAIEEAPAADGVIRSVRFEAVKAPEGEVVKNFRFSNEGAEFHLRYAVSAGRIVPSNGSPAAAISSESAESSLGMFWDNGDRYVKLYGAVDPSAQTVAVRNSAAGTYQIRAMLRDQSFTFDIANTFNKAITPNGDGRNDAAVFMFDNPRQSAVTGEVFDTRGAFVATMTRGPVANSLQWDGRSGGSAAPGGVYIYRIRAEGESFTGTVIVIR